MVQNQKSYQRMMFVLTVVLPVILLAVMLTVFTFNKGYQLLEPLLCSQGDTITWEEGELSEYYMDGEWHTSRDTYIYCVEADGQHGKDLSLVGFAIYLIFSFVPAGLMVWVFYRIQNWYYKRQWKKYQGEDAEYPG
jgi:cytochrome c oxidase subunit IV